MQRIKRIFIAKKCAAGHTFLYALIVVFFSFSTVLVDRMIRDVNED